ncbi:MAG TPA: ankyrin repeat domain-containing protein [Verrucomicrobiales bacterium]|nr:ankyrin repeat domain-containing protein [Verrucomicrobiales bacterium]
MPAQIAIPSPRFRRRNSFVRNAIVLLGALAAAPLPAVEPNHDLFQAVRNSDDAAVKALLRAGVAVDARDVSGDTPLIDAALYAGPEVIQILLEAGADVNAANHAGATALMRAATRPAQAALLLDAGADVQARSQLGNTALILAARKPGSAPTVLRLLDAGADVNASNIFGASSLMAAAAAEDLESAHLLLDRGADVDAKPLMDGGGFIFGGGRSPLMWASFRGNEALLRLFLDHGARVDDVTIAGSALSQAAWAGHSEAARVLIDAGAQVDNRDPVAHFTPLHWAASSERTGSSLPELLLSRGADPNAEGGDPVDGFLGVLQTPLMLARQRGDTPIVQVLLGSGARPSAPAPVLPPHAGDPVLEQLDSLTIAAAVARALPPLQKTAAVSRSSFLKHASKQNCLSCHQQYLPMGAVGLARELRLPIDQEAAREQIALSLEHPTMPKDFEAQAVFHPAPAVEIGYHLLGLLHEKQPACELTDAFVHHLSVIQGPDGRWFGNLPRPPLQGSDVTATALAIFSLNAYPLPGRRDELEELVRKGVAWLRGFPVESAEERAYQLLGLYWANEGREDLEALAGGLAADQRSDGGWAQLPSLASDAYATGLVLFSLAKVGCSLDDPAVQRAARFLLSKQEPGGTWRVRRRAFPFQPPMESGFPYGADSWISAAASSWAAMALASLLDPAQAPVLTSLPEAIPAPETAVRPHASIPEAAGDGSPHDFASVIRPVLERSCLACHSGEKPKAGFRIQTRTSLLAGGNRGEAAVVPGDPEASPLLLCVAGEVEDLEMPPLGKRDQYPGLNPAEIASLRAWIFAGADWPDGVTLTMEKPGDPELKQ